MTSLSWLIYAADATPRVVAGITVFSAMALVVLFGLNIHVAVHNSIEDKQRKHIIWPAFPIIFTILVASAVPSKQAIYMIAASEMGQRAIKTEMASDLFEIVTNEIKKMKEAK